jgi:hypothetical protein
MRRTICASFFALATVLLGAEARAAGEWGLHTGDTIEPRTWMPYVELGWPDISGGFQYGLSPKLDIGARLSFPSYGWEYTTYTDFGLGARAPIRFALVKRPRFSAQLHVDPGIKLYFNDCAYYTYRYTNCRRYYRNNAMFGIQVPFGVEFGIHINREWTVGIGADIPLDIIFPSGADATFVLAPLVGAGFEYHVSDHFGIGFNGRFGPVFFVQDGGYTMFGFTAQFAFIWHL